MIFLIFENYVMATKWMIKNPAPKKVAPKKVEPKKVAPKKVEAVIEKRSRRMARKYSEAE